VEEYDPKNAMPAPATPKSDTQPGEMTATIVQATRQKEEALSAVAMTMSPSAVITCRVAPRAYPTQDFYRSPNFAGVETAQSQLEQT